jgi:hypothetical protein
VEDIMGLLALLVFCEVNRLKLYVDLMTSGWKDVCHPHVLTISGAYPVVTVGCFVGE